MSEPAPYNGSQLVLDVLVDEGIEIVFGYPGGAIMPLYDAMYNHPLRHILTRHEAGAAFAAGGYARSTGNVGVCLATSGPGATNLITGIVDAQMDSVPLLAITGQVPTHLMGTDGFQEADVTSIAQGATKRAICVRSVAHLERTLRAALRLARGPRPGAVLVDIPKDILTARCEPLRKRTHSVPAPHVIEQRADDAALDEAAALIRGAKRPVAIVGGGARTANATHLYRTFCALLKLPHASTINALGCAEPGDERFLGMCGMHGWKAANLAITQADVIIALGMRFDDRVTGRPDKFAPGAKIIHADIDPSELSKIIPAAVALRGDLRDTLTRLSERLRSPASPTFEAWATEAHALGGPPPRDRTPGAELSATDVLDAFFARLPADAIVATDVGQHQMWAAQRQHASTPRSFITSAGLGSMGFGLPAAIGAQFGNPERTVVAICGDGGFQMTMSELATIKRYDLPLKILLIDNQRLGMVRQWQELFYERRYAHTDLSDNPDFVTIAQAYNLRAEFVGPGDDLEASFDRLIRSKEAMLLHCACYPSENVWPLIPPGGAISEGMEPIPA
ncbi:MAG TPA: biosynthetic-type acetolactate synthase large subunit [Candidatus Baltobacteraceae bacterium]